MQGNATKMRSADCNLVPLCSSSLVRFLEHLPIASVGLRYWICQGCCTGSESLLSYGGNRCIAKNGYTYGVESVGSGESQDRGQRFFALALRWARNTVVVLCRGPRKPGCQEVFRQAPCEFRSARCEPSESPMQMLGSSSPKNLTDCTAYLGP